MLIQFTVENFKSIKDEQTLSLVKNSANEMSDNYFTSNASATPDLLKTAVIYGANASGKSNLLKALASMNKIIENSFKKKLDESIILEPFLLDPICRTQPTTFQAVFIVQMPSETGELRATRVEYGFSGGAGRPDGRGGILADACLPAFHAESGNPYAGAGTDPDAGILVAGQGACADRHRQPERAGRNSAA